MDDLNEALALEKDLIPPERWKRLYKTTMPDIVKHEFELQLKAGGSIGIGRNKKLGWFILVTAGQGPCLVWQEKK
jgi:hypothetical protein